MSVLVRLYYILDNRSCKYNTFKSPCTLRASCGGGGGGKVCGGGGEKKEEEKNNYAALMMAITFVLKKRGC